MRFPNPAWEGEKGGGRTIKGLMASASEISVVFELADCEKGLEVFCIDDEAAAGVL